MPERQISCNSSFRIRYSAKHKLHVMRDSKEGILSDFVELRHLLFPLKHNFGYVAFRLAVSVHKVVREVLYSRSAYKGRRPVR